MLDYQFATLKYLQSPKSAIVSRYVSNATVQRIHYQNQSRPEVKILHIHTDPRSQA